MPPHLAKSFLLLVTFAAKQEAKQRDRPIAPGTKKASSPLGMRQVRGLFLCAGTYKKNTNVTTKKIGIKMIPLYAI